MSKMLIIDGQVFQTPAWHRGMGKYSYELIKSLNRLNTGRKIWSKIVVVLTGKLPLNDEVADKLNGLGVQIKFLDMKTNEFDNRPVATHNRKILDSFIADLVGMSGGNTKIDYFVCSLMQSEIAPVFSSLKEVNNAVILYDLIPYMFHDVYLHDSLAEKSYMTKFSELLRADIYLAISKTVANDLTLYTGIDSGRIISIDGGPISHAAKSKKLDVPEPFVLMPTGDDLRKNNKRGVEGFSIFNDRNAGKYSLVVTSHFTEPEKQLLKSISDKVVFTDNISGEELNYLYEHTEALLFPSEYEGLGMPILEALEKNKPVACSNISVFREMSTDIFEYFHPDDTNEIADALQAAVSPGAKASEASYGKEARAVLDRYSWSKTADKLIEAFKLTKKSLLKNYGLTMYGPSARNSLLGGYIQRCHSDLSKTFRVEYCLEDEFKARRDGQTLDYLSIVSGSHSHRVDDADGFVPVFSVSNDGCTGNMLAALAKEGIALLYDIDLTYLWDELLRGKFISEARYDAERKLNERFCGPQTAFIVTLLSRHKKIVVSTENEAKLIKAVAKKCGIDSKKVEVSYIALNRLPYPEIMEGSGHTVLCISNQKGSEPGWFSSAISPGVKKRIYTASNRNEFEFINSIASSRTILIDSETVKSSEAKIMRAYAEQMRIRNVVIVGDRVVLSGVKNIGQDEVTDHIESIDTGEREPSKSTFHTANGLPDIIKAVS